MSGTTSGPLFGNNPNMTIGGLSFANPTYSPPPSPIAVSATRPIGQLSAPDPTLAPQSHDAMGNTPQNGPIGSVSGANPLGNMMGLGGGPGGAMIGGGGLLGLASMAPGPLGFGIGAVNMARKGYNLATEDAQGQAAGYPPMTLGQAVGGLLPLVGNGYGSGAQGQASYDQAEQAKLGMQPTTGSNVTADPVDRMTAPAGAYGDNGSNSIGAGLGGGGLSSGTDSGPVGGSDGGAGFSKGGIVTQDRLSGPKPPGPDTGYAPLQPGEMVVRRAATGPFAPLLMAINNPTPQNLAAIGGGDPRKGAMMLQALMAQMPGGQPQAAQRPQQQIPPQVIQALMQQHAMQAGGGGASMPPPGGPMPGRPPMPAGGPPGAPPGQPQQPQLLPSPNAAVPPQGGPAVPPRPPMAPPPAAPGMAPQAQQNLAMFGRGAQPQGQGAQMRLTPAEMAHAGRFGDSLIAHLTPGEVEVPPQVQTPQLMQAIAQAFAKAGVSPQQFTAGSPQSSHNPATGAPEYNFLSALLPTALGSLGSLVLGPEVLAPMLGIGDAAASAIGGGLGGALGTAIGGGSTSQDLVSGIGGAAGSYLGGNLGGGSSGSPQQSGQLYGSQAQGGATAMGDPTTAPPMATAATATPFGSGVSGSSGGGTNWGQVLGAGAGAGLGSMLTPKDSTAASELPPGFNNPMPAVNPNYNQLLGNNRPSRPNFQGYNPYASVTGGAPFNFY